MSVGICLGFAESILEVFGSIVAYYGAVLCARTVVPAHTYVRIIWKSVCAVDTRPFVFHPAHYIFIVVVDIGEVNKLVVCAAGETEFFYEIVARISGLSCIESAVVEVY